MSCSVQVGALFSASVVDKFGRRPLLLSSVFFIMLVNLVIFGLMRAYSVFGERWIGFCLIGAIAAHLVAFTVGPGPLCYFITSEMITQHARSAGQSWAAFVQMAW